MVTKYIYAGDKGVVVRANIIESTLGATKQEFHIKRPDGTEYVVTTTNEEESDTNTKIKATIDFPTKGKYYFQPYCEWSSGSVHLGKTFIIEVFDKYVYVK